MVFGLFKDSDSAELALTNFSEIGVGMRDVSAIAQSKTDIEALNTHGLLTGVMSSHTRAKLANHLDEQAIRKVIDCIEKNGIVLVVVDDAIPQEIIEETLKDYNAEIVSADDVSL